MYFSLLVQRKVRKRKHTPSSALLLCSSTLRCSPGRARPKLALLRRTQTLGRFIPSRLRFSAQRKGDPESNARCCAPPRNLLEHPLLLLTFGPLCEAPRSADAPGLSAADCLSGTAASFSGGRRAEHRREIGRAHV